MSVFKDIFDITYNTHSIIIRMTQGFNAEAHIRIFFHGSPGTIRKVILYILKS